MSKKTGNIIAGQSKDRGKVNKREMDRPEERDGDREGGAGRKEGKQVSIGIPVHTYVVSTHMSGHIYS